MKSLSPEEERIIVHKTTERPYSGEYWDNARAGSYECKRCGQPLFSSDAKFSSGTGWPTFDKTLPGAVTELPDDAGARTEVVCSKCGAHLGHMFYGEGFTGTNERHCVNSLSLEFVETEVESAEAYFAGGCFWGVEHLFQQAEGVISVESGYMGGRTESPSYEEVSSGDGGHVETVKVVYDTSKTDYVALARLFFEIHDPTQVDGQGPDVGEQYRSVVFYTDKKQLAAARKLIALLKKKKIKVVTKMEQASDFWPAEDYHQDYYNKTGKQPHCHSRVPRF